MTKFISGVIMTGVIAISLFFAACQLATPQVRAQPAPSIAPSDSLSAKAPTTTTTVSLGKVSVANDGAFTFPLKALDDLGGPHRINAKVDGTKYLYFTLPL